MPVKWKATTRCLGDGVDTVQYSYEARPTRPDDLGRVRRWTLEKRERGAWTVVESYDGGRP